MSVGLKKIDFNFGSFLQRLKLYCVLTESSKQSCNIKLCRKILNKFKVTFISSKS